VCALFSAIDFALEIYIWVLLALAVVWWLIGFNVISTSNKIVANIESFLATITAPARLPFQYVLPEVGGQDISPCVLILAMVAARHAIVLTASAAIPIIGVIDNIQYIGGRYYVFGWACERGNRASIDVHIYSGGAAGGKPLGTFVTAGKAGLDNEPAVDRECQDANGGKHRFKIELPNQFLQTFQRKSLFAHGIAVDGNVKNAVISQSGKFQLPSPKWPPDPR